MRELDNKDIFNPEGEFAEVKQQGESSKLLHNIKAIIFDFDGTLFDYSLIALRLIAANPLNAIRVWQERLVRKRFAGCDYSTPENYYHAFFTAMGKMCLRSQKQLRNWYFNRYMPRMVRVLRKHYELRPGVQELFNLFETSSVLHAAVYSDYPFLKERLHAVGLNPDTKIPLYGPDSFGAQKPAARPFLTIAKNMGASPKETLVIGDRDRTDGLGAFNAGMRYFCLETGKRRYFRTDPYRRRVKEEPHGPSLALYSGKWDDLVQLLFKKLETKKN